MTDVLEWVRFIVAAVFIIAGLLIFAVSVTGVYRFKFVLNRMHSESIGDTLGISCVLIGLIILYGLSFAALKLVLIIIFFWISGPVSSHLLTRLEVNNNEHITEELSDDTKEDL